ncbi:MAG: peptidoglycan endopeptidase [Nitrospirae bacterium]|nr:MAG: peptidoglycan endopeptidase [Nitrospirota bacterium]
MAKRSDWVKSKLFHPMCLLVICLSLISCERKDKYLRYAVAVMPTPVLNTPDFSSVFGGKDGRTLKLNRKNMIEEVEFVALSGTSFTIEAEINKDGYEILKVKTEDYPYPTQKGYYIDSRFVEKKLQKPPERLRKLPDKNTIINKLISAKGAIYVWGGNHVKGIPELLVFYKPVGKLSEEILERWMLKGVDCSGLLYEASDGYTPRNVESLFDFGSAVDIKDMKPDEIAKKLKPLDLIVYKRHVVIVLDSRQAIQSTIAEGVQLISLTGILRTISETMTPVTDPRKEGIADKFVVRRWHPQ